jgi:hypothetical protein
MKLFGNSDLPIEAVMYDEAMRVLTTVLPRANPGIETTLNIKVNKAKERSEEKHPPYMAVYHIKQAFAQALRTTSSKLDKKVRVYRQLVREDGAVRNRFMFIPGTGIVQNPTRLSMDDFRTAAMIEY